VVFLRETFISTILRRREQLWKNYIKALLAPPSKTGIHCLIVICFPAAASIMIVSSHSRDYDTLWWLELARLRLAQQLHMWKHDVTFGTFYRHPFVLKKLQSNTRTHIHRRRQKNIRATSLDLRCITLFCFRHQ